MASDDVPHEEERVELLTRSSSSSSYDRPLDIIDGSYYETSSTSYSYHIRRTAGRRILHRLLHSCCHVFFEPCMKSCGKSCPARLFGTIVRCLFAAFLAFIVLVAALFPSYTHAPSHYQTLRQQIITSQELGRGNPHNQTVFIAVTLYDKNGFYTGGEWGSRVLHLIDLIGPDKVFLSLYENDSAGSGQKALEEFKARVPCRHEIVHEHIDLSTFPTVQMMDGTERVKRIQYLSELRNRSLRPLDRADPEGVKFDRILFLNDVYFDPIDAAQLLFSTNAASSPDGKADYLSVCALDHNADPVHFYDSFAMRDQQGYETGFRVYPWFSQAGAAASRRDALAQKDAVRVRSCWGGLAAFDAKYFQAEARDVPAGFRDIAAHNIDPDAPRERTQVPIRFRAEPEIFADSCECCLLQADLQDAAQSEKARKDEEGGEGEKEVAEGEKDYGVYLNPYVRVAYSPRVLAWSPIVRRFERLLSWLQWWVNVFGWLPHWNGVRAVEPGQAFKEEVWVQGVETGRWELKDRAGRPGLFCMERRMQVLKQRDERKQGRNWEFVYAPGGRSFF